MVGQTIYNGKEVLNGYSVLDAFRQYMISIIFPFNYDMAAATFE